jgi:hypothetical protein
MYDLDDVEKEDETLDALPDFMKPDAEEKAGEAEEKAGEKDAEEIDKGDEE